MFKHDSARRRSAVYAIFALTPALLFAQPPAQAPVRMEFDAVVKQAAAAGAQVVRPVQDQFYGDRGGTVTDPYGHVWHVSTHKEDLSMDELRARAEKAMAGAPKG